MAQRKQAEGAMQEGGAELEAAERGVAETRAAETRVAESEAAETKAPHTTATDTRVGETRAAQIEAAAEVSKSSEAAVGKEVKTGQGDQRGAAPVAESPGLAAGDKEQLHLAKGFAEVEGLGAENVRGLEPEVGLPPLEKPPVAESTSKGTPGGSQKVDGSRRSGGVPRREDDRLSAAAKILGTIRVEQETTKGGSLSRVAETEVPARPVEKARAGETSERALAAAEVFKMMQQAGREAAAADEKAAQAAGDELPRTSVSPGDADAAPEPSRTSSRAETAPPVKASDAVARSNGATESPARTDSVEALTEADGDEIESEETEEFSSEQEILLESAALAHVPEAIRAPLSAAADLQKIPVGLGADDAVPSQEELDMAYVYPEVLTAAEELEWASKALEEVGSSSLHSVAEAAASWNPCKAFCVR